MLIVALTREAGQELNRQFRDREISKTYVALVEGTVVDTEGSIALPLRADLHNRPKQVVDEVDGKHALTEWSIRSMDSITDVTLLELKPVTGRTHQLRVHLTAIGHPILGDTLYNDKRIVGQRLMLHAERIQFKHPVTAIEMNLTVPAVFT